MVGKLFIDGKDAYLDYGVFVENGGLKQVIQVASFKKLTQTEWPDEDGVEVDLDEPVLDTRSLQIQFCIVNVRYAEDLFEDLSTGSYHDFYFSDLKKTWKLRMTQNGNFSQLIKLGKLTLTFADDFPVVPTGEAYQLGKSDVRQVGYEVDNVDMSQFGAFVLKGTDENIRKAANTKDNLKSSSTSRAGLQYDGETVYFKTKDVQLKLLINAPNIDEFWRSWDSLFATLLKSKSRTFYYTVMNAEYECYYKSNAVSKLQILGNGRVWCEFTVTLTFTSYRPIGQYMLLATEGYDYVLTEDGAYIRIRPKFGISLIIAEDGSYIVTEPDEDKVYIINSN